MIRLLADQESRDSGSFGTSRGPTEQVSRFGRNARQLLVCRCARGGVAFARGTSGSGFSRFTFEQYLELEADSRVRHELSHGLVVAMAGGNPQHNAICASPTALIAGALEGSALPRARLGCCPEGRLPRPVAGTGWHRPGAAGGRFCCKSAPLHMQCAIHQLAYNLQEPPCWFAFETGDDDDESHSDSNLAALLVRPGPCGAAPAHHRLRQRRRRRKRRKRRRWQ